MSDQKKTSVWRAASLTVMFLIVCAVLSVATINLVVIPFFNAGKQSTTITGAVPQVAQATVTVDFEQGPPPPPTATGEFIRRPTLDVTQAKKLPTSVVPPDVPTLEPEVDIDAVAPTFESVVAVAPSGEWATYTDPNFGFSFQYPSNWYVEAPKKSKQVVKRVSIIVRNYEEVATKGDKTIEQLKIDIDVDPLPDSIPNLEAWTAQIRDPNIRGSESSSSMTPVENIEIDGIPAVRWRQTAQMIPQGSITVGVVKDSRIYVIWCYPTTSKYISTFDQLISGFRLP